jgi:hypothetical protein
MSRWLQHRVRGEKMGQKMGKEEREKKGERTVGGKNLTTASELDWIATRGRKKGESWDVLL